MYRGRRFVSAHGLTRVTNNCQDFLRVVTNASRDFWRGVTNTSEAIGLGDKPFGKMLRVQQVQGLKLGQRGQNHIRAVWRIGPLFEALDITPLALCVRQLHFSFVTDGQVIHQRGQGADGRGIVFEIVSDELSVVNRENL
jgi:hypothetical protein